MYPVGPYRAAGWRMSQGKVTLLKHVEIFAATLTSWIHAFQRYEVHTFLSCEA